MLLDISFKAGEVDRSDVECIFGVPNQYEPYRKQVCAILISGGMDGWNQGGFLASTRNGKSNISRWKSLYLELAQRWQEIELLSEVFQCHAPKLTAIQIIDLAANYCEFSGIKEFIGRSSVYSHVTNTTDLARFCELRFAQLQSLDITYGPGLERAIFDQLGEMKLLRALVIRAFSGPGKYKIPFHFLSLDAVSLPQLAYLSLDGPVPDSLLENLNLPSLKRLTIITRDIFHVPKALRAKPEELF
jgi:hypothetical protein